MTKASLSLSLLRSVNRAGESMPKAERLDWWLAVIPIASDLGLDTGQGVEKKPKLCSRMMRTRIREQSLKRKC